MVDFHPVQKPLAPNYPRLLDHPSSIDNHPWLPRPAANLKYCPKWRLPDSKFWALSSFIPKRCSEMRALKAPGQ